MPSSFVCNVPRRTRNCGATRPTDCGWRLGESGIGSIGNGCPQHGINGCILRPNLFLTDEQFLNYLQEETCWPWASLPGCTLLLTPWGVWERLTTVPQLRRVEHLALASGVVDVGDPWETEWLPDELAVLLSSGHLRNLRELDLSPLYLTQRIADLLSTAPNLSSMQGLRISFHRRRGPDRVETLYRLRTRFKDVTWE